MSQLAMSLRGSVMNDLFQKAQDAFSEREYHRAYDLYNQVASENPSDIRSDYLKYVARFHADPIEGFKSLDQLSNLTDEYMKLFMIDSTSLHSKSYLINEVLFYSASLIVHLTEIAGDSFNNEEISGDTLITLLYLLSRYADSRYSAVGHERQLLDIDNGINMLCEAEKIVLKTVTNARAFGVTVSPDDMKFFAEISDKFVRGDNSRENELRSIAEISRQKPEPMTASIPMDASMSVFIAMATAYTNKIEAYAKRPLRHIDDLEYINTDVQELIVVLDDLEGFSYKEKSDIYKTIIVSYNHLILKMLTFAEKRYCDRDGKVDDDIIIVLRNNMISIAYNSCAVVIDILPLLRKYPRIKDSLDDLCHDIESVILFGCQDITTISGGYRPVPLDFRNTMIKISKSLLSVWEEVDLFSCINSKLTQVVEKDACDSFPAGSPIRKNENDNKWQELYDKGEREQEEVFRRLATY